MKILGKFTLGVLSISGSLFVYMYHSDKVAKINNWINYWKILSTLGLILLNLLIFTFPIYSFVFLTTSLKVPQRREIFELCVFGLRKKLKKEGFFDDKNAQSGKIEYPLTSEDNMIMAQRCIDIAYRLLRANLLNLGVVSLIFSFEPLLRNIIYMNYILFIGLLANLGINESIASVLISDLVVIKDEKYTAERTLLRQMRKGVRGELSEIVDATPDQIGNRGREEGGLPEVRREVVIDPNPIIPPVAGEVIGPNPLDIREGRNGRLPRRRRRSAPNQDLNVQGGGENRAVDDPIPPALPAPRRRVARNTFNLEKYPRNNSYYNMHRENTYVSFSLSIICALWSFNVPPLFGKLIEVCVCRELWIFIQGTHSNASK